MKYTKETIELLADFFTPVALFMKLRQSFHQVLLLESSDYSNKENSQSFIAFESTEGIEVKDNYLTNFTDNKKTKMPLRKNGIGDSIKTFINNIKITSGQSASDGIFGFCNFESVELFEKIELNKNKSGDETPLLKYDFYRFVIAFDHFYEKLSLTEYIPEGKESRLQTVLDIIKQQDIPEFSFRLEGKEEANCTPEEFMDNVRRAKSHLRNGDVFQVVLSRSFQLPYSGDAFEVYRCLRSVNPSPYLYFYDYGSFKIFGSSPEAQLVIKNLKAEIHPIAGTVRRSADHQSDIQKAQMLSDDPKENAEHVMLVDLARNDLGKHGKNVKLRKYKEIQFFSHVIHLTSIVEADIPDSRAGIDVFMDSFPAGTLSGAPKHRAMQIIDKLEKTKRGFYGGAIGMIALNGDINHAILIRSFLAKRKKLRYQAGAGIVMDSIEKNELQEVNNKLAALKSAIQKADKSYE